ncbi:hypothetical protein KR49_13470 [Synechococcus sp. KORDI-49]|nr:hypothetical protein KR49_13470 [Synechococcus sp. KORDI-49]
MTQKELRNLALSFVRDELPFEFEDCIARVLDRFPEHLQVEGRLSDYEVEDLVYSDHYYKHIKEYLLDFVVGKVFMSVEPIPNTSIATEPLFASV